MSRHTDAANAAYSIEGFGNGARASIDWSAVSERGRITSTEEFRSQYMCQHPPLSFAG